MTKFAKRTDENQSLLVEFARQQGIEVVVCSHIGGGFPDLMIKYNSLIRFVEIKNKNTQYGKKGLNDKQLELQKFFGEYLIIWTCTEDILQFISDNYVYYG